MCATNIARELSKDNRYLLNAATDLDGRSGLRYLKVYIEKGGEGKTLSDGIDKALMFWDKGAQEAAKQAYVSNEKNLKDNFSNFEQELKKQLESQGVEIGKAYYKAFTGNQVEIRAEVKNFMKGVSVETKTGGSSRIYTGNSDILIGGYDFNSGKFVPKETMEKHGTAEKSAIQPDDIVLILQAAKKASELLIKQLGKGLTREAADLAKNLGRDALKTGAKDGGKDAEKVLAKELTDAKKSAEALKDTAEDITKTFKREKPPTREASGKARKGGDTQQDLGDTLQAPKLGLRPPSGDAAPGRLSTTKAPSPYSEMDIATIGEDAARKARDLGITRGEMSAYLDDKVWKAGNIDDKARFVSGLAGEEGAKVARDEINTIVPLGRDTTRNLMNYGYSPSNLSDAVKAGLAKGSNMDQIRRGLNNELKMMDHLRTRYCGNNWADVRAELKIAEDPRAAMRSKIHQELWSDWKRRNPRSDELPVEMRSKKLGDFADKAAEMTKRIEKRLLGPSATPAIIPLAATLKGKDKAEDPAAKEKKKKEEEKNRASREGRGGTQRDPKQTASNKETKPTQGKQSNDQQKAAKKEKDERELKKAAEREKGGTAPPESSKKEGGGGGESKEVKKDAPASDSRVYPK